jgi:hypothetical protein
MKDQEIVLQLQTQATAKGFDVLIINAGKAKGWDLVFDAQVLKDSLPLWASVPCFLDHDYTGSQSVRNLAGALHSPLWNETEQGVQAQLIPGGPGAKDLQDLYLAAKADPAILAAVGFSAHLYVLQDGGIVKHITKAHSVDCVIDPARGGKFLSAHSQGEIGMKKKVLRNGAVIEVEEKDVLPTDEIITKLTTPPPPAPDTGIDAETQSLLATQAATKAAEGKNKTAAESLRQVRLQTCRNLLQVSLEASHLPGPSAERVGKRFNVQLDKGDPFEPGDLENSILEEQALLSALTAAGAIQGPGRISSMSTSTDQLEAAVSDLFSLPREARLQNIKPAHLTGIRELYLMLTGDYDLHGGFYGERIQLATTADFTGLVKNALNKVVAQQWEALGKAGYDWWEKIVKVEHFTNLNSITGTLIGTVGALPTVAEGAEYTELAIGDSPETASFTKYGGYIPLTLELIDRDETRKLKAYASELGSAARRKISALIAAIFTANAGVGPTMADTGALFNNTAVTAAAGHANLLVTALAAAEWEVVSLAVYNQPMLIKWAAGYYGTGPKMAISPRFCLVPRALQLTAMKILYPSLENAATIYSENQQRGQPGDVVTVPEWTDASDWAAVVDPVIAPAIIVGERFGLQPEIFTAGNETDPAVFMNDEHRIKVRMFNAVLVQDFRPLHKSNV